MDRGGWKAAVHVVAEGRTRLHFHFHFSLSCIGEGNGNPLQCSHSINDGTFVDLIKDSRKIGEVIENDKFINNNT